jgi:hypothetical protein
MVDFTFHATFLHSSHFFIPLLGRSTKPLGTCSSAASSCRCTIVVTSYGPPCLDHHCQGSKGTARHDRAMYVTACTKNSWKPDMSNKKQFGNPDFREEEATRYHQRPSGPQRPACGAGCGFAESLVCNQQSNCTAIMGRDLTHCVPANAARLLDLGEHEICHSICQQPKE